MRPTRRLACLAVLAAITVPSLAVAQSFPSKAVKIIVPYPAGGPTDALARILANEIAGPLGQGVVVENRAGASGAIGTRETMKADADGHTLVLGTNQTHATNQSLMKDAGYDAARDFAPVAGLTDLQHVLVVRKGLGVTSVAELVAKAKAEPGKLNAGSTGAGSASHLALELFKVRTGTAMQHVPFKGAAPLTTEIIADRIDLAFATLPSVIAQIEGGQMVALAVASPARAPQIKTLPTLAEAGVANAEADAWLALFAPAATPSVAVDTLAKAVTAAMDKPAVREAAAKAGFAINVRGPVAFKPFLAAEIAKWAEVVRVAGVKVGG